jgi:hypothetical protein
LTAAIRDHLAGADILVHVEPRDRVDPGAELLRPNEPAGRPPATPAASA